MLQEFVNYINASGLFQPGKRILLAVSGGMDSMVMADLFRSARFNYAIAHCNFMLRGDESDEDERFVGAYAVTVNVPFFSERFDTAQYARSRGISIQMAARDLRYAWFNQLLDEHGYDHLATAHHRDDSVETFLINLSRGTGISGLHGIPAATGRVVRPLMFCWRRDIESYAREHKLSYREDSSNRSDHYLRNKIRHEVIPLLEKANPGSGQQIFDTSERLRDVESIYNSMLEKKKGSLFINEGSLKKINLKDLLALSPIKTWVFELLKEFGVSGDMAEKIAAALEGIPGKTFSTDSHQLLVDREELVIRPLGNQDEPGEYRVAENENTVTEPIKMYLSVEDPLNFKIAESRNIACLDLDKIRYPLTIRRWREGDKFMPLGMKGMKKLSDFFIDEKFSRFDKENAWILTSGEKIVWIIGHRIDDRFKVTDTTKRILVIKS